MEEKCVLPHARLLLEESQRDEFCGDTAWLAEGRGDGPPGAAASLCPLLATLCCVWSETRAVCWRGMPGPRRVVNASSPSAISETSYLANSGICLKEMPQIFPWLPYFNQPLHCFLFILSSMQILEVCMLSWKFPRWWVWC